jgi:ribosomal RNA-processing protein 36
VNVDLHAKAYDFLPGMLSAEFDALKTAVAMAVKAERLEAELGKQRTRLERTRREARDREVLAKVKKEEREKQKQGKGAWHMKQSEKRDLLLKSRFESLEEEGGKAAVRKAMDKKRKKIAGKEKKSRPPAQGDAKRRRV